MFIHCSYQAENSPRTLASPASYCYRLVIGDLIPLLSDVILRTSSCYPVRGPAVGAHDSELVSGNARVSKFDQAIGAGRFCNSGINSTKYLDIMEGKTLHWYCRVWVGRRQAVVRGSKAERLVQSNWEHCALPSYLNMIEKRLRYYIG